MHNVLMKTVYYLQVLIISCQVNRRNEMLSVLPELPAICSSCCFISTR